MKMKLHGIVLTCYLLLVESKIRGGSINPKQLHDESTRRQLQASKECLKLAGRGPTCAPTSQPSKAPSNAPTGVPSKPPTPPPTSTPSKPPTPPPTSTPSKPPTPPPTSTPSKPPTPPPTKPPTKPPTPPPTRPPTKPPTKPPTRPPTFAPTYCPNPNTCLRFQNQAQTGYFAIQKCAASCDFDIQCERGLTCHKRRRGQTNVPGCFGNADLVGNGNHNFCVAPASNQLVLLGMNKKPSSAYPLRRCAGDCDSDSDCANGLFCFERNALESVPGCIGSGQPQFDYCYSPGNGFERLAFYGDWEYDYYELGQCEGDCDFDSDCDIGLVCYERERGDNGRVPKCVGNANLIGYGDDDFCIPRPTSNTLISVYENDIGGDTAGGGIFPIPRCAGDCDSDADCQWGLTCYQRSGFTAVPGCSGSGEEDFDYCI